MWKVFFNDLGNISHKIFCCCDGHLFFSSTSSCCCHHYFSLLHSNFLFYRRVKQYNSNASRRAFLSMFGETHPGYRPQASWESALRRFSVPSSLPTSTPAEEIGPDWFSRPRFVTRVGSEELVAIAALLMQLSLSCANHSQLQPRTGCGGQTVGRGRGGWG